MQVYKPAVGPVLDSRQASPKLPTAAGQASPFGFIKQFGGKNVQ